MDTNDEDLKNIFSWSVADKKLKQEHPVIYYYEEFKFELEYKFRKIRGVFNDFKYGIQNLIKWFPVIWKDRDWDYYYLLHIMQKKLEGMEELLRVHGNHLSAENDAKEIRVCIELIKRINGENGFDISDSVRLKELKENVSSREAYKYMSEMESYYKDELFNRIRKHIYSWWD